MTKIFMRESEQTKLEYRLHQQIMASIITIQRWFRAVLERRRFLALRRASMVLQYYCRYVYLSIKSIKTNLGFQKFYMKLSISKYCLDDIFFNCVNTICEKMMNFFLYLTSFFILLLTKYGWQVDGRLKRKMLVTLVVTNSLPYGRKNREVKKDIDERGKSNVG